jgi:hypothetical protein
VKTDSPQLGYLLEQVVDALVNLGEPGGILGRDTCARRRASFLVVLSGHES